jgi:hypothetical protein
MSNSSAARRAAPATTTATTRRPGLRVLPGGRTRAPRAPFVVLVLLILGAGLVGLLLLNTGLQQGSFELRDLQRETRLLRDERAALAQEVSRRSAPAGLAELAGSLGMVPAGSREYLVIGHEPAPGDGPSAADETAQEDGP